MENIKQENRETHLDTALSKAFVYLSGQGIILEPMAINEHGERIAVAEEEEEEGEEFNMAYLEDILCNLDRLAHDENDEKAKGLLNALREALTSK